MYSLLFSAVSERHVQQRRVNVDVSGSLLVTGRVSDVLPAVLRWDDVQHQLDRSYRWSADAGISLHVLSTVVRPGRSQQ